MVDWTAVITAAIAATPPSITSLIALRRSTTVAAKVKEIEKVVNGGNGS